jgi:hypothetical protein
MKIESLFKHPDFYESWKTESKGACMEYLHGDVEDGEYEAALYYEYARESETLRELAARLEERCQSSKGEIWRDGVADAVGNEFARKKDFRGIGWVPGPVWAGGGRAWFQIPRWQLIWECASFPRKAWNDLTEQEREQIVWGFGVRNFVVPLTVEMVDSADSRGVFDKFKAMAAEARDIQKASGKSWSWPPVDAILEDGQWSDVLFRVNFSESPTRMRKRFEKWLQQPKNKARFQKYKKPADRGYEEAADNLKDLAVVRLYRSIVKEHKSYRKAYKELLAFTQRHRLKDSKGVPRKFHSAKPTKRRAANMAPLYRDSSGLDETKVAARDHFKNLFPDEVAEAQE